MPSLRRPAALSSLGALLPAVVFSPPLLVHPHLVQEECEITVTPDSVPIQSALISLEYSASESFPVVVSVTSTNPSGLEFMEVDRVTRAVEVNTSAAEAGEWPVIFHGPEGPDGEATTCTGEIVVVATGAPEEPAPEPAPAPLPEPTPDPEPTPAPLPEPTPEPDPTPAPLPEPTPEPDPTPAPLPEPTPDPEQPVPMPNEPEPLPEPDSEPTLPGTEEGSTP